jgi:hypothetical protein
LETVKTVSPAPILLSASTPRAVLEFQLSLRLLFRTKLRALKIVFQFDARAEHGTHGGALWAVDLRGFGHGSNRLWFRNVIGRGCDGAHGGRWHREGQGVHFVLIVSSISSARCISIRSLNDFRSRDAATIASLSRSGYTPEQSVLVFLQTNPGDNQ